jgi:hypothetical protein
MPEALLTPKQAHHQIIEAWKKYCESGGTNRTHLEYIQNRVDKVGQKFVLVIPAKNRRRFKDVPYRVMFKPTKKPKGILISP